MSRSFVLRWCSVVLVGCAGGDANRSGDDTDDRGLAALATAPVAVGDAATVEEGSADNRIDVLANDQNLDAGLLVVLDVGPSTSGATVAIADGGSTVLYTPPLRYCNQIANMSRDIFTYSITGGSSASVTVTVSCACGANRSTDFLVEDF